MYTGQARVSEVIETHMSAGWAHTPVAYQNVQFDDEVPEFVKLHILWTGSRQASMGGERNKHRFFGMAIVQIYVPVNSGTRHADQLAANAVELFITKQFQGITFLTPDPVTIGDDGHGKYQVNVNCPFYYDDLV